MNEIIIYMKFDKIDAQKKTGGKACRKMGMKFNQSERGTFLCVLY